MRLLRIAGLGLLVILCAQAAHAEMLTVDGGSVAVSAQAGLNWGSYIYDSETPTPLTPVAGSITTLTAEANGTAYGETPERPPADVSGRATTTVDVHSDASSTTAMLYAHSSVFLSHYGPGAYCCGQAEANALLFFTLTQDSLVTLDWPGWSTAPFNVQGQLQNVDTGQYLFDVDGNNEPHFFHQTLLLTAGRYRAYVKALADYPPMAATVEEKMTLTFTPAPVPVPAAVWLFGSALAGLAAARRRRFTPL